MKNTIPKHFKDNKSDRAFLTKVYVITPLRRFQCLPNKPVLDALYKRVDDVAYQFEAYERSDPARTTFSFYTGHVSGDDFLRLTGQMLPPLQTWETLVGIAGGSGGGAGALPPAAVVLDPFNAQLLTLLGLFFLKFDFDPAQPSALFFRSINAQPQVPQTATAGRVNSILAKFGETSTTLVAWLSAQTGGRAVRPMRFDLLHAHLIATGVSSPAIQP